MTSPAERQISLHRSTGNAAALAESLVSWASDLVTQGRLREALRPLDEAAGLHRDLGHRENERHCRQFSAILHRLTGDFAGARERARRAAQLAEDGSPAAASAHAELAETAQALGDLPDAERHWRSAVQAADAARLHPPEQPALLRKHAACLGALSRAAEGLSALDRAAQLLAETGDRAGSLRARVEAATLAQNAGLYADAMRRREAALLQAEQNADPLARSELLLLQFAAALPGEAFGELVSLAQQARDAALAANAPVQYVAAVTALAEVQERSGDRLVAYASLASGYVTLGDLLGTEVGKETFAPKLRDCRQRWGEDAFRDIKARHDALRRAARDS